MKKHLTRLALIVILAGCSNAWAEEKLPEQLATWYGNYRGFGVDSNNEPEDYEFPVRLRIMAGNDDDSFSIGFNKSGNTLEVSIGDFYDRNNISPVKVTDEELIVPPVFAEPIGCEIRRVNDGFNEQLIVGTITFYKVSMNEKPEIEKTIRFKAGRI